MKYSIFILGFLISAPAVALCQVHDNNQAITALSKDLVKNQSNSDAVTFGGYLSAVWHFMGKTGNTFAFQPRLYDLDKIFCSKNIDIDTTYARKAWERNLQINIGLTPNSKNLFNRPVNFQMGFSYAVINNKEIPLKDYNSITTAYEHYTEFQDYLTGQVQANDDPKIKAAIIKSIYTQNYSSLPEFLRDSIKNKFGLTIRKMMTVPKHLVDSLTHTLPRRPLLIVDVDGMHGLGNRNESELDFKTSFSSYIFEQKTNADPQFSLSASYSLADDTTQDNANLNRNTLEISAGINIIFFSIIDFKPGVSYTNIISGIYAKEHQTSWSPTASLFVKIAKKLVIALNWSYDSDKALSTTNIKLKTSFE